MAMAQQYGITFVAWYYAVNATEAGTILVVFTDANNAVITYTVDGVQATKTVTRQLF